MPQYRVTVIRKGLRKSGNDNIRTGFRKAIIEQEGRTPYEAKHLAEQRAQDLTYGDEYDVEFKGSKDVGHGDEYDCEYVATEAELLPSKDVTSDNALALYQQSIVQINALTKSNEDMAKAIRQKDEVLKSLKRERETLNRERGDAQQALQELQSKDRGEALDIERFGTMLDGIVSFLLKKTTIGQKFESIIRSEVRTAMAEKRQSRRDRDDDE